MTHNQHAQPIQCHYAVSKEYINSVPTDTAVESPNFPIYLQIKDNCFKVQIENDLYLLVSYQEIKTKAQTLEQLQQNKVKHLKETQLPIEIYPYVQHTDVTLKTNETEPFIQFPHNANNAELINTNEFSLKALDDFISKSPEISNYSYNEQIEINDTPLP